MIFDALGRLALGQVQQDYTFASRNLTGVAATGAAGLIGRLVVPALQGVAAVGDVGSFTSPIITRVVPGVSGAGAVGLMTPADAKSLLGVSGTGSAGLIGRRIIVTVNGVQGAGIAGTVMTNSTTPAIVGVSATGYAGNMLQSVVGEAFLGAAGIGYAGQIKPVFSGGGDSSSHGDASPKRRRRRKTGMEPVRKLPPAVLAAEEKPKLPLPPWRDRVPALVPKVMPDDLFDPGARLPKSMLALQDEIYTAQDISDINDVLALLEAID